MAVVSEQMMQQVRLQHAASFSEFLPACCLFSFSCLCVLIVEWGYARGCVRVCMVFDL